MANSGFFIQGGRSWALTLAFVFGVGFFLTSLGLVYIASRPAVLDSAQIQASAEFRKLETEKNDLSFQLRESKAQVARLDSIYSSLGKKYVEAYEQVERLQGAVMSQDTLMIKMRAELERLNLELERSGDYIKILLEDDQTPASLRILKKIQETQEESSRRLDEFSKTLESLQEDLAGVRDNVNDLNKVVYEGSSEPKPSRPSFSGRR